MIRALPSATAMVCIAAVGAAAAAPAPAVTCRAIAKGAAGDAVDVVLRVPSNGQATDRLAYWHPAPAAGMPAGEPDMSAPAFDVVYHPTAEGGLGEVSMVMVYAAHVTARPEAMKSNGVLVDLDGRTWHADTVGIGSATSAMVTAMFVAGNARQPDSSELFRALGTARTARVDLRADGQVIRSRAFDVSRRESRDQLFARAWSEVVAKAQTPEMCRPPAAAARRR